MDRVRRGRRVSRGRRRDRTGRPDRNASDPKAILATDIFQRHVMLGPVTEGASVGRRRAAVVVNGEEVAAAATSPRQR